MKRGSFSIFTFLGLLIVLLLLSLSQLTNIIIRCTSIKEVKYEVPDNSSIVRIEPGLMPVWIRYNGKEYVEYEPLFNNHNKIPEVCTRKVGKLISEAVLDNNGQSRSIYNIDDTNTDIAVAVATLTRGYYARYFNEDYIWKYQKTRIAALVILSIITTITVVLIYVKNKVIK